MNGTVLDYIDAARRSLAEGNRDAAKDWHTEASALFDAEGGRGVAEAEAIDALARDLFAPTFHVEIDGEYGTPEGAVRVIDNEGAEYVMWDSAEWIEDPSLVYVILNYVRTALTDPAALPNLNPNLGRWQSYSIVPDDGLECVICGERIDGDAWVRETELFTGPEARCAKHGAPGGGPPGGEDA